MNTTNYTVIRHTKVFSLHKGLKTVVLKIIFYISRDIGVKPDMIFSEEDSV